MKNHLNVVKWDDNTINRKLDIIIFEKGQMVEEEYPDGTHTHKYWIFGEKNIEMIEYDKKHTAMMNINITKVSYNEFYCDLSFTYYKKELEHTWLGLYGDNKYKPMWQKEKLIDFKRKCKFSSYEELENYVNKYIENEVIPYVEHIIK